MSKKAATGVQKVMDKLKERRAKKEAEAKETQLQQSIGIIQDGQSVQTSGQLVQSTEMPQLENNE